MVSVCYSSAVSRISAPLLALLLPIALAVGAVPCMAGEPAPPARYRPAPADPEKPGKATLLGATWTQESEEYAIRVQQITDEQRVAFIEHVTGVAVDPFGGRPDAPQRFFTFVLEVENRGEAMLGFHPRNCWMQPNRSADLETPMSLSDLAFEYRVLDMELPPSYEKAAPALYQHSVVIEPGASRAGLLVYKALNPKNKHFNVDVQLAMPDGDIVKFSAHYVRIEEEKKKKKNKNDEPDDGGEAAEAEGS